jgi:hypothetical protein
MTYTGRNNNRIPDYGPNRPEETGVRWPRYERGFALRDIANNRLYSGAPPLNPFTNRPYLGCTITAPRADITTAFAVGCVVQVNVGDPYGGRAFREFIVGPGSPVALALGQYASASVNVVQRSLAVGTQMNTPPTIQWVDDLPSLPDVGRLRSPAATVTGGPGPETNVPDGAFAMIVQDATIVIFNDYSGSNGGLPTRTAVPVAAGGVIQTQGQTFIIGVVPAGSTVVRFLLAGL